MNSIHRILACALLALLGNAATAADAALLWFEGDAPTSQARQALRILNDAASDGLAPGDYQAKTLEDAFASLALSQTTDPARMARLDQALSLAMERYLSDLHAGRIKPAEIHENFDVPAQTPLDSATYLRHIVEQRGFPEAVRAVAPTFPLYASLRKALAQYRALVFAPAWRQPLPPLPDKKLESGLPYAGLSILTARLIALGDLPPEVLVPQRYEGAVVNGVRAFQLRHGLEPDGVIGRATFEQLQVTPAARVEQIGLSLERLRWTPLQQASRMIVINIPEFMLHAYDTQPDGKIDIRVEMKVILGKALNTRTPIFDEDMRFIEFSPYWNVPPSIARAETVPALRHDPGYLQRQQMEFVSGSGQISTAVTEANLQSVLQGAGRIRQRPGPHNALGDIKFIFPNNENIYLHHTPAVQLFNRNRRDFSHGCIRVEDPVALARFVLEPEPEWTTSRIRDAMEKGESRTIRLKAPLPVLIAYSTVMTRNGQVYFYDDIYSHDKLLATALSQRKRPVLIAP